MNEEFMGFLLSLVLSFSLIALSLAWRAEKSAKAMVEALRKEIGEREQVLKEEFQNLISDMENRMTTRILVGDTLIRAQVEPGSPLHSHKPGLIEAISFGAVEFLTYRAQDYDAPLSCCHHGGGLAEGEQFYLIPLNNAPEEGAVLAVCLDCHRKERELVPQG